VASSSGLIWFNCVIPLPFTSSQLFQEEIFERSRRDFLNDLDLSALSQEEADGAPARVDMSLTPVVKATANRCLEMPLLSSVVSLQHVEEDTGRQAFLLTPPRSNEKKVRSLFSG